MNMELFWAYFAGFFDGEGNLSANCSGIQLKVSQSGPEGLELLTYFQSVLRDVCKLKGHLAIYKLKPSSGNLINKPKNERQHYDLKVCHRDSVEYILKKIHPYLHIKRLMAQDILRFCRIFPRTTRGFIMRIDTKACPNGHEYTEENTIWRKKPGGLFGRACRTCKRAKDRRGKEKKAA